MTITDELILKYLDAINSSMASKAKLGSGGRFKALKKKLGSKGATNPGALAAYIGRKKYGKSKFQGLAAKGKKKAKKAPSASPKY